MTIQSSIQIRDGMSGAFRNMTRAMNLTLSTFEAVQRASHNAIDTSSITAARESLAMVDVELNEIEESMRNSQNAQQGVTRNVRETSHAAGDLWNKIRGIAATIGGMKAISKVVGLSDELTQTKARLSMVVDDGGSVAELQQKIHRSAQRARADYLDVADVVAKLSLRAGDAFAGNDETIQFAENLNKQFIIAGASQEEMRSASLQLTQALGSGVLRGEELNAVFEAAPNVIQTIADYLDVPIGNIREMASEGQITAEIVKNAMLASTDSINEQFESMPMTWGQVWAMMKNDALAAFEPILERINELANSEQFEQMRSSFSAAITSIASLALDAFTVIGNIANFVYENWSAIAPLIYGVVGAFVAYKVAALLAAVATNIFSAALWSNPITWIIGLIGLLIAGIYQFIQAIGGLQAAWLFCVDQVLTTWDSMLVVGMLIYDHFMTGLAGLRLGFYTASFWIQDRCSYISEAFMTMAVNITNFMGDMKAGVLVLLQNMVNGAIGIINSFIGLLNNIPGVSIDAIAEVTFGAEAAAQNEAEKQARNAALEDYKIQEASERQGRADLLAQMKSEAVSEHVQRVNDIRSTAQKALDDHESRQREITALTVGKGIEAGMSALNGVLNPGGAGNFDPSLYSNNGQLLDNTGDTAENTARMADSLDASKEELKLIREIAERQAINKFTTAEVKVDMTGMTNKIEGSEDIDGFISKLADQLEDALVATAEGVHA